MKNHMLADLPVYYFETEENVKYLHDCKDIDASSSPTSARPAKNRSA